MKELGDARQLVPMAPLRCTCKSVRTLAAELTRQGHAVSHQTISEVLRASGYSLQANRKTRQGAEHPDRNAQFEHIARRAREFQQRAQPVISVDTKKKELVADTTGLKISVCHLPPGTSKWNKIEHRMFCHSTRNWRERPLESLEVVDKLIASTTTTKGLRVRAAHDNDEYPTGVEVDAATMASSRKMLSDS